MSPTSSRTPSPERVLAEAWLALADMRAGEGDWAQRSAFAEWEWRRCAESCAYWIDHYGWIKVKDGTVTRFRMWPAQREMLASWQAGDSSVSVKSRQLGVTTLAIHYLLWRTLFLDGADSYLVADSEKKALEAVKKVRVTLDRLPSWMRERARSEGVVHKKKRAVRADSVRTISFGHSHMNILTSTPNSVAGVSGVVVLDEFNRHKDQQAVLDNALPAVEGGGQLIVIGNGGGEDELYWAYTRAKQGDLPGFVARFFWWGDDPTRLEGATVDGRPARELPREELMAAAAGMSAALGDPRVESRMSCPWYEAEAKRFMRKNPERDVWSFRAQYPSSEEEAFHIAGNSFFDLKVLNTLKQGMAKVRAGRQPHMEVCTLVDQDGLRLRKDPSRGRLRVFERPKAGADYVIGVDPAGGYGDSHFSVAQVCRLLRRHEHLEVARDYGLQDLERFEDCDHALMQVAVYQARSDPDLMALVCERLARFYGDALVVVERNNHGQALIPALKTRYHRLWMDRDSARFVERERDLIGYHQSTGSKTRMCDTLAGWMNKGWVVVNDPATFDEMRRFEHRAGRSPGAQGKHTDDLVVALGLCVVGAKDLTVRPSGPVLLDPLTGYVRS